MPSRGTLLVKEPGNCYRKGDGIHPCDHSNRMDYDDLAGREETATAWLLLLSDLQLDSSLAAGDSSGGEAFQ